MTPYHTDRRLTPLPTGHPAAAGPDEHAAFLAPLLQPGFHVLDASVASASATGEIAQAVLPGKVTVISASTEQLQARRRLIEGLEIMNVDFIGGEAESLPFADCTFDVVFAQAPWTGDTMNILREFHRVIRPGGFIGLCRIANEPLAATPTCRRRITRALNAFHALPEERLAETDWDQELAATGFVPLAQSSWTEEMPLRHLDRIVARLDQSGQYHHARELRDWRREPGASLYQTWDSITAVRADEYRRPHLRIE